MWVMDYQIFFFLPQDKTKQNEKENQQQQQLKKKQKQKSLLWSGETGSRAGTEPAG